MLQFAPESEIMSLTRPHTMCRCCARRRSIRAKNAILSYLFIMEEHRRGAPSRLRGLAPPPPAHTHTAEQSEKKQKVVVVNRERRQLRVRDGFLFLYAVNEGMKVETGHVFSRCSYARGQIIDSYYRDGDSWTLQVVINTVKLYSTVNFFYKD